MKFTVYPKKDVLKIAPSAICYQSRIEELFIVVEGGSRLGTGTTAATAWRNARKTLNEREAQ